MARIFLPLVKAELRGRPAGCTRPLTGIRQQREGQKIVVAILKDIRVLDFGRYIAGPYCAGLLADLGADVIRVEPIEGGDDRYLMPATFEGEGAMYLQANRNKRAITLA